MGVKITGLNKYSARLRSESKRIVDEGEQIAKESAEYGADLMRQFVRAAVTNTGLAGVPLGRRGPGREDTGALYDAIQVGPARKLKNGVAINFGWGTAGGSVQDYFYFQEVGAGNIPPMHALLDALVRTRQYFYARIKDVV